ncbi:MAG: ABC transporter ATP-binding protein [Peptococcaceae bacterium]|nr:ABC transporter ATP-binding protein [Peptococcaceae bacterium]
MAEERQGGVNGGSRPDESKVLEVRNLSVVFRTPGGVVRAVRDVSFAMEKGRVLAVVGESGCGKSVTARSVMGLLEEPGEITGGQVSLEGVDLLSLPEREKRKIMGSRVSMVFQDPLTSFDPVFTIGAQFMEVFAAHRRLPRPEARRQVLKMLAAVRLQDPERVFRSYPFQLSGGMRQRVMIAMAMALKPALLIADEPTTALDVTVQAGIIGELRKLKRATGCALLIITHDLGVVAEIADDVLVMYAGRVVEKGSVDDIFYRPAHPYTAALLRSFYGAEEKGYLFSISGQPPDLRDLPPGCSFAPRCPSVQALCLEKEPDPVGAGRNRGASCWYPLDSPERVAAGA